MAEGGWALGGDAWSSVTLSQTHFSMRQNHNALSDYREL